MLKPHYGGFTRLTIIISDRTQLIRVTTTPEFGALIHNLLSIVVDSFAIRSLVAPPLIHFVDDSHFTRSSHT